MQEYRKAVGIYLGLFVSRIAIADVQTSVCGTRKARSSNTHLRRTGYPDDLGLPGGKPFL